MGNSYDPPPYIGFYNPVEGETQLYITRFMNLMMFDPHIDHRIPPVTSLNLAILFGGLDIHEAYVAISL